MFSAIALFPLSFIRFHYIYSHFMQISCSILNVLQFTPKLCLLYYSWVLLHRVHHACQPDITCSQMGSPHVNYSIISQDYPFPNGFLRNTPGYGTRNNCKHLLLKLHAFGGIPYFQTWRDLLPKLWQTCRSEFRIGKYERRVLIIFLKSHSPGVIHSAEYFIGVLCTESGKANTCQDACNWEKFHLHALLLPLSAIWEHA